jgi:hypothetical protein
MIELINLNKNAKFKASEWIESEYEIFNKLVVERYNLMRIIEFKQSHQNIQRALHPQTLEEVIKSV